MGINFAPIIYRIIIQKMCFVQKNDKILTEEDKKNNIFLWNNLKTTKFKLQT